jgi:hypothetical protein
MAHNPIFKPLLLTLFIFKVRDGQQSIEVNAFHNLFTCLSAGRQAQQPSLRGTRL